MYKATVRALVRHSIRKLNEGDPSFVLRLAAPGAEICFPGDNSWSTMFRPVPPPSRALHVTHRGIEECRAFADAFVAAGLRFEVEDILVNGGPWRTRVAVRATDGTVDPVGGPDGYRYTNRVVACMELRWGRLVRWEDFEDTTRTLAWDRATGGVGALTAPASPAPSR